MVSAKHSLTIATLVVVSSVHPGWAQGQGTIAPSAEEAAGNLEEVVVTAEKREESIQTLPIAISAYSTETLTDRGIHNLEALNQLSPSVRMATGSSLGTNVIIRGIGGFAGFEPAVALVQDGVPYTSLRMGGVTFFDAEQIEVLRGPQGTLGGRNATAGGVYVRSKRPTDAVEGYFKGTLGNYDRVALEGALGGPLVEDRLLARIAVGVDHADGWIRNTQLQEDLYGIDRREARLSLLGRLSEDLQGLLILQGRVNRGFPTGVAYGRSRPDRPSLAELNDAPQFDPDRRTVAKDEPEVTDEKTYQATLRFDWDMGRTTRLTSITGYVDYDFLSNVDEDGSTLPLVFAYGPRPRVQTVRQASQELTLAMDLTSHLDLVLGALYVTNEFELSGNAALPFVGIPRGEAWWDDTHKLDSWAGYSQLRYQLTNDLRVTAGVRYTSERKHVSADRETLGVVFPHAADAESWDAWTPRLAVDWQAADRLMLYATAARGFKSGGFEHFGFPSQQYKPEYIWNYEMGAKASGLQDRLRATLSVFSMDYTDLQQTIAGQDPGQITFRTVNATSARIRGVEFDLEALLLPALRLTAAGAYLHTRYGTLRSIDPTYPELGDPLPSGQNVRDLTGNRLAGAPQWQFNLAADYTAQVGDRLEAVLRASYSWNGQIFLDIYNNPGIEQPSYGLVNLSASLQTPDENWQLTAFVENLTGELYLNGRSGTAVGLPVSTAIFGEPRRFGLRLERRF